MNVKKPVKIIYDTDIGGDCDDAGTMAMLHRLCELGEAELLAVTHCYSTPYVAGCIDAINHYYHRVVPVGINYEDDHGTDDRGVYAGDLCDRFPNRYPASVYGTEKAAPDTVTVLRKALAASKDGEITFVVTGSLQSMARLVTSPADEISPLTGKELIARKIARTVVMGGRFFESWPMTIYPDGGTKGNPVTWEWNVKFSGPGVPQTVCDEWPGELIFASYELGSYLRTMVGYSARVGLDHPVGLAYELHNQGKGRCSWDQVAMLEAVRPGVYWNYHEFGKITVDKDFVTHWHRTEGGKHSYLLPKADYEDVRLAMDDLINGAK